MKLNYKLLKFLFVVSILLVPFFASGQTIQMQRTGRQHETVYTNGARVVDEGGAYGNYHTRCSDTLTITSVGNRPFVLTGSYNIGNAHYLKICQGPTMEYPIENFYSGSGDVSIYCYSGSVTLYFYSNNLGSNNWGFDFQICFPNIDVTCDSVNTDYASFRWQPYTNVSNYRFHMYKVDDQTRTTTQSPTLWGNNYSNTTVSRGSRYGYYLTYGNYDTSSACHSPVHFFRTPNVNNCGSCDHYRNCIDFTNLTGSDRVFCYKGSSRHPDSIDCTTSGSSEGSIAGRHVVNTAQAISRYTTSLNVIPQGASQSVRLGNWNGGSEGESVVYEILVDTNDYNLLLLNYAVAFLNPISGSTEAQVPRFSISLYDQNCIPINPLCYHVDILPTDNADWHNDSSSCKWLDWSQRAIDLESFHGKTLFLELTTRDGKVSGGAAWAYFTLQCKRKQLDHVRSCGNSIANTFYAPDGFQYYKWYNAENPSTILSTNDSLVVTNSGLYNCYVGMTGKLSTDTICGFIINALATERYAKAHFTDTIIRGRCSFTVKFTNRSKVVDANGNPLWTNEDCESAFWDFGNGQTSTEYNTEVVYNDTGSYVVTLIARIAGGACADTLHDTIRVDWLYPRAMVEGTTSVCPEDDISFEATNTTNCVYFFDLPNFPPHSDSSFVLEAEESFHLTCITEDRNGCRDTSHFNIVVNPIYDQYDTLVVCSDDFPLMHDGRFYNSSNTSTYVYEERTVVHNCDSIINFHLHVNPSYSHYLSLGYCERLTSYSYADTVYTTLGQHDYTYTLATGCDSVIHLDLYSISIPETTYYERICQGYPYSGHGFQISSTQNQTLGRHEYSRQTSSITGCDSLIHLILTVNAPTSSVVTQTVFENDLPFVFNGQSFTQPVENQTIVITNRAGCDSTIHFTLNIIWNVFNQVDSTICASAIPMRWNNRVFTNNTLSQVPNQPGKLMAVMNDTLRAHTGADSILTMTLFVYPTFRNTHSATICDDTFYTFCGQQFAQSGTYPVSYSSIHQCDSVEVLTLVVNQVTQSTIHETIIENQLNHTFLNCTFTTDVQDTTIVITNQKGCDSIIHYSLTVYRNAQTPVDSTICQQSLPLTWNGITFPASLDNYNRDNYGNYFMTRSATLRTSRGADSVVLMTLTVKPTTYGTEVVSIVENSLPYTYHNRSYRSATQDEVTLVGSNGCDSIVLFTLIVHNNATTIVDSTVCDNSLPLVWNDSTFTQSDIKQTVLQTSNGADSVVTMRLHVNPTYDTHVDAVICDDSSVVFAGSRYQTAGVYRHQLLSQHLCDSIATLQLTVHAVTHSLVTETIVENDLPYTYNGHTFYSDAAQQPIIITNSQGCDSMITYFLIVNRNVRNRVDSTICITSLPLQWNARTFTMENMHYDSINLPDPTGAPHHYPVMIGELNDTLTSYTQADSILTMRLIAHPTYDIHHYDTICNDDVFVFMNQQYTQTGVSVFPMQSQFHCDSVETLHLQVWEVTYGTVYDTVIENLLPHTYHNAQFADSVSHATVTITNLHGCDSIVDYSLYVHRNVYDTAYASRCENLLPYRWNARTFTTNQFSYQNPVIIQNDTLRAYTGADSILTMVLTVDTNSHSIYFDTVLENNLPHRFNDSTFTTDAANHPVYVLNERGCDSVIYYNLFVHRNKRIEKDSVLCVNATPLDWNGKRFVQTSSDSTILTGQYGVDSLVVMHVRVDTNTHSILYDTIVENDLPFTWNHRQFTTNSFDPSPTATRYLTTMLRDTLQNRYGCDSLLEMNLLVWNNVTATADSTICENFYPFSWNDTTFTQAGTQQVLLRTTHNADSLLTMNVSTYWNTSSVYYDTVVENNLPRRFNDSIFYTDVSHSSVILPNSHQCDSVIDFSLKVHWNIHVSYDSTICDNFLPLTWGLYAFDQAGTRTDTLRSYTHADSITTLNLRVNPTYHYHHYDTICNDSRYPFLDSIYTLTGVYSHPFSSSLHCDSIETLHLQVWEVTYGTVYDTVIENLLPHTYHNAQFADSVSHTTVTITNLHGCDSIVDYSLYVHRNVYDTVNQTICENLLPYRWNARTFTAADFNSTAGPVALNDTLLAYTGADSILTMYVTVLYNSHTQFADTVIQNLLPYRYYDSVFYDSVTDSHVIIPAANGCDSITHFSLHVWHNVVHIIDTFTCDNQLPFTHMEHTFTDAGIQYDSLFTSHGADSIIHITLTVWPTYYNRRYDTICDYSGVMTTGVEYMGIQRTISIHGCDSTEEFHLWGNPVSYVTIHDTVAESQLPYTYNGQSYGQAVGNQRFVLTNQYQCDSIVNYSLSVFPTLRTFDDSSICYRNLPLSWGGVVFQQAGSLNDTLRASSGADSIVTRRLHVSNDYTTHLYDTACSNVPYQYLNKTLTTTCIDSTHFRAINGCDSLVCMHLQVYPPSQSTVFDTVPQGFLPYSYHGYIFNDDVTDTTLQITNYHGCDSTVRYSLHIYRSDTTWVDTTLCENLLPVTIRNVDFTAPGTGQHSRMGVNGVDSITVVTLHTYPSYRQVDSLVACDTLTWKDGITYTASTDRPTLRLPSVYGCDSILVLNLTVNRSVHNVDEVSACDSYTWFTGQTFTRDTVGVRFESFTGKGCDSTITLSLEVHPSFYQENRDTICVGVAFDFHGRQLTQQGVYFDSLVSRYRCDSVYREELIVLQKPDISFEREYDCETGYYTVTATSSTPYFVWSSFPDDPGLVGQEQSPVIRVKPQTHETYYFYTDYYELPTCPNTDTIYLSPLLKPHAVMETTPEFLTADQLWINAINRSTNELTHEWYVNGNYVSSDTRFSYKCDIHDDSASVLLVAHNGVCLDSATTVIPFRKAHIWAGNVFTPGESSNNKFYVYGDEVIDYEINIYTRGGTLVFHSTEMDEGWDGTANGVACPQAAYVWVVTYTDSTAPKNQKKFVGTVTLLR